MVEEKKLINKIGLVYSGGLARGAAQLSFAKQIFDKIGYDKISVISGSSIGSLNSYATSAGTVDKLLDFYSTIDCDSTKKFMKKIRNQLFSKAFNAIEKDTLNVPTYVSGTKIFSFDCHYFCLNNMPRSDIKDAINLSMGFPIINGPHKFNRKLWIDGGATDNIPVLPVTYFDCDMVIILHCYPKYYPPIDLYRKLKPGTVIVDIDITLELPKSITSFSLAKEDFIEMISIASREGKIFADEVFSDMDMDNVKERCYKYTRSNIVKRNIKSGDGLMSFVDVLNALYRMKENVI